MKYFICVIVIFLSNFSFAEDEFCSFPKKATPNTAQFLGGAWEQSHHFTYGSVNANGIFRVIYIPNDRWKTAANFKKEYPGGGFLNKNILFVEAWQQDALGENTKYAGCLEVSDDAISKADELDSFSFSKSGDEIFLNMESYLNRKKSKLQIRIDTKFINASY